MIALHLAALLWLSSSGDEPRDYGLTKARTALEKCQTEFRTEALAAIEKLIKKATEVGNLAAVNTLTQQKEDFESSDIAPPVMGMSAYRRDFSKARNRLQKYVQARREMVEAFTVTIATYTKEGKIDEANALQEEAKRFLLDGFTLPDRMTALSRFTETQGVAWTIVGDELFSSPRKGTQRGGVLFGDPTWRDYILTYEMKLVDGRGATNALFHAKDWKTHRVVEIGGYSNGARDVFSVIDGTWQRGNGDVWAPPGVALGEWHKFEIRVMKSHVTVFVDGQQILAAEKVGFDQGRLGFGYGDGATAHVRNVSVVDSDGLILWKGVKGLDLPAKIPPK